MATNETPRFKIPYPAENDKNIWYPTLANTLDQFDTQIFGNLEQLKPIFRELPWVDNQVGPNQLVQTGDLVMISRTYQATVTVAAATTALTPEAMLCIRIAGGTETASTSVWEVVQSGADADPDLQVFGYVDSAYNIFWYNGSTLPVGSANTLFGSTSGGGAILSGLGNPNGVVAGLLGQTYIDITVPAAPIRYWCIDGAMTWFVD
jgi:hypothetical protein